MLWCSLLLAVLVMFAGWLYEGKTRNAGVVDVLWAGLMAFLPVYYAVLSGGDLLLRMAAGGIMSLWYTRLFWHLSGRVFSEQEDGRYRYLRQYWGNKAHRNHFFFFQFQALLAFVFTLPVWWLCQAQSVDTGWVYIAVILAVGAGCGVFIADKQLQEFRQDQVSSGQVCERGLWYYSRHPNYFFEWLHWFCYPILGLGLGVAGGGWLWLAPLVMLVFLYFITGIPYTEQQALRSRGDAYRRYQETTSAFIPWRKKHAVD